MIKFKIKNNMEAIVKQSEVRNFIDGKFIKKTNETMDIISPLDGSVISKLPISNYDDVDNAVKAAKKAFISWS